MTQSKVTSHDVARLAGVSRTTVSMVLNGSDAVVLSQDTRQRVLDAAAALGYRPNSAARMLVRGNTETIGLIVSDPAILPVDGFVPQVLLGIGQVNRSHGYHVLLEALPSEDGADGYENLVHSRRIDGLIVLNPRVDDPHLKALVEREFPVVLVGSIRHPLEYAVNFSTRDGIAAAAELLVGYGHRAVGLVSPSPPGFIATEARLAATRRALGLHGLSLPDTAVEHGDFSAESGHHAALRLLARRPDLTAIFAGNDTIALGVVSAIASLGKSVPHDISVIGFDDLPFAAWLTPALTTIKVDGVAQGAKAAELLVARLKGLPIPERQIRMPAQLVVRQSCGPARPA